jgi:CHAT domain-containing protein/Tfp pilus assembly protein PilF
MLIHQVKVLCVSLILFCQGAVASTSGELVQQGQAFFQRGAFARAIERWETALKQTDLDTPQYLEVLSQLAVAYQGVGNYAAAHAVLQQALQLAKDKGSPAQQVLLNSQLSDVLLATQQPDAAKQLLEDNLTIARTIKQPLLIAHLLNNLGNVLSIQQEFTEALPVYTEAADLAQRGHDQPLQVQSLLNQAKVHLKLDHPQASLTTLTTALTTVRQLPNTYEKGVSLLGLGQLALQIQQTVPTTLMTAYQIFQEVLPLAKQMQDNWLIAYAKGALGEVYERQQRYPEALQLTRQAIFAAQEQPDILYLWESQLGRLLLAQQDLTGAVAAYQQARDHLYPIQSRLVTGQRNAAEMFRERIRPVYFGFGDVLLQTAAMTQSAATKQQLLKQAREVIEQLKAAELQDYFQDECVSFVEKSTQLDHLEAHTAVLYPVLLPKRTELLLSVPDGIHQVLIPVGAEELGQTILEFRRNLQTSTHNRFVKQAKQLYKWLIVPLHEELKFNKINTLVIIPDGPLRTIPLAALYNEKTKQFLIEEMAIAITPGLNLTEPRPLVRQHISILLNGLSESVQNFSSLPSVPKELRSIEALFENHAILLDKTFLLQGVNQTLQKTPYTIVHIASHGQFDSDPKKTFVLTYDDKLTMNRLENLLRFTGSRKEPVELLTLSACQTAVGDERAALGLAGVAVKAGARSALASLWFVNDESTTELVTSFYQQLQNPVLSKAQALQNAQKKLLGTEYFRHPMYWAPFLLIGNWL